MNFLKMFAPKLIHCWEGSGAGGEGDDRGWDGWMASPTRWMWVWVNSGSWWWTRRPGMLQSMGLQRVRHDWTTELNWTEALSTTYTAKLFEVNIKLHKILFFVCVFANVIYLQKQKGTFNLTTISLSHLIILLSVLNASILWHCLSLGLEWKLTFSSTVVPCFSSVQFSRPVMSNSLRPHGLQHARPPCLSPPPKVCPSSGSLHRWCHPTISSSDALFSFCPQSIPASRTLPMSHLFTLDDQNTGASSFSISPTSG